MSEQKQELRTIMIIENENGFILVNNEKSVHVLQPQQESFPSKDEVIEESDFGINTKNEKSDFHSAVNHFPLVCSQNAWNSEGGQNERFEKDEREIENRIDENEISSTISAGDNDDIRDDKWKRDGREKMENGTKIRIGNDLGSTMQNENLETRNESKEIENDDDEKSTTFKITAKSDKVLISHHEQFLGVSEERDEELSMNVHKALTNKSLQNMQTKSNTSKTRNHKENEDGDISERYLCHICGKTYSQVSHLSRHIKTAHNKESFLQKCTICDKTFSCEESLIRHLKLHEQRLGGSASKGPFKCPLCSKTYQQQYNVTRHLLTHYGKKPFQCPECYKTFTQHTGLARHLIIHKGSRDFKCDVCGKAFARQFVLSRHKLIHTDDKPYKCFVCSKSFIRGSQLECHIKMHKKEIDQQ